MRKMRVAVSSTGADLDAAVDPRFGRCPFFIIVDTDTMEFEAVPNVSWQSPSGAGIEAAQIVANKNVQVVLTGDVGPNAYKALSAAGIQVITGITGTVRDVVEKYRKGGLNITSFPVSPGYDVGPTYGRRGGRGMDIGRWTGGSEMPAYRGVPPFNTPVQLTREQEIQMLQNRLKMLQEELDWIKKRLEELKK